MRAFMLKKTIASAVAFILFSMLFFLSDAAAQTGEYETIARNFLLFRGSDKQIVSSEIIRANSLAPDQPEVVIAFLAKLQDGGYIFVSATKNSLPVKAYSLTGDFDSLPGAYRRYLFQEAEARVRNNETTGVYPMGLSETQESWDFLLQFDPEARTPLACTPPSILLLTRWNQGTPYNKYLPEINGKKVVAGCVSVAMAQLMKYHRHPATGTGTAAYIWKDSLLSTSFNRPYNWANMPDSVSLTEEEYKSDEVALLLRDLAIVNSALFGDEGTSAVGNFQALAEHFHYAKEIESMDSTKTDADSFFNKIKDEIDGMRPVILELPGHMVVADGYGSDPTGKRIVHMNMGWGGNYDDYYFLEADIVAGPYTFSPSLVISYNIKPCTAGSGDCAENLEYSDIPDGSAIKGKFDYAADADRYALYLKGATTIGGSRGYENQAFYISVRNSEGRLLQSSSEPLTLHDLPFGLYTVRISLLDESTGARYPFDDYTAYTATLTTQPLTVEEKAAVDANLDSAPFIGNTLKDRILNSTAPSPSRILIDARDPDGDTVTLGVASTNPDAIVAALEGNILVLTPVSGTPNTAGRITITATANGKQAEKSFIAMIYNSDVGYGKSFSVSGIFENQEDFNQHSVILEGNNCSVAGYNGYSNQAFYSSLFNSEGTEVVPPQDATITGTFTRGIFKTGVSLQNGSGNYYTYKQGFNDQYQLTISCPEASEETSVIAGLLGIDLSKTLFWGDIDNSGQATLADAVICLQALSGMNPAVPASSSAEVNGDGKIGLQEVIFILQKVAALR